MTTRKTGSGGSRKKRAPSGADVQQARRAMEGVFSLMLGGGRSTPVAQAQDLIYEAWESRDPRRRVELALGAIEVSPNCADAFGLLAQEATRSLAEATELYRKALAAGERALGKRAFKEDVGHFWGILETRPYMRARLGLAQCLWEAGQHDDAIGHYRDMLRLNPNDNQGIRYLLAACLLEGGRDAELAVLLEQYGDDGTAAWAYTAALLAFRGAGPAKKARQLLAKARATNPHVPAYLLGRKKLPKRMPAYVGLGDENEAIAYAGDYLAGWKKTPGALEWLAED